MVISQRNTQRIPLDSASFLATWLSDWEKVDKAGILLDISPTGFCGLLRRAPANGHLLHARLSLHAGQPIDVNARVCGRQLSDDKNGPTWTIHCAIETIHPVDEKRMLHAIAQHTSDQH